MINYKNKPFVVLGIISALFAVSFILYLSACTSLLGGLFFSFLLIGFWYPQKVLAFFLFCMAYKHKEFAYLSLQIGSLPIYITEWVLLILGATAVPKLKFIYKEYRKPLLFILLYFGVGAFLYAKTVFYWGVIEATRDFAIIYYSFFTLLTLAHIRNIIDLKWLVTAVLLGTLPNLLSDTLNFLYGTLPVTALQENYSLRSSFYYSIAIGFLLPLIFNVRDGWTNLLKLYFFGVCFIILFYAYSKTSMIALLFVLAIYGLIRHFDISRKGYVITAILLVTALFFTPQQKQYPFGALVNPSTYSKDIRTTILVSEIRDFVEYPYGIGFGSSIFGPHSDDALSNVEYYDAHNSYIAILRRVGIEGMLIYLSFVAFTIYSAIKRYRGLEKESYEARFVLGTILAFVSVSFYLFSHVALEGPFFGTPYWILLGILWSCSKLFEGDAVNQKSTLNSC